MIEEKLYKAKDLGVPSRTIFHWKEKNLLFEKPENKEKNTMLLFSLSEYFWIEVIKECRYYGLSLNEIKTIKTQIIDIVKSHDINEDLNKKYEPIINNLKIIHQKETKEFIDNKIEETLKFLHLVEKKETKRNYFNELLDAVIENRKPSGLLIYKNSEGTKIDIYIEGNALCDKSMLIFHGSHLYISFDAIFTKLGLSDHFKNIELLTEDEKKSISIIRKVIKSEKALGAEIEKKGKKIKTINIKLKHPINNKEVEEYKKRLGENLNYKTAMYNGKLNLFDFYYKINFKK